MPSSRRSSKRPYSAAHRPLEMQRATGGRRQVTRHGEEWTVQPVRGNEKEYVCPGCHHRVAPWTAHVVAWANESIFGEQAALDARRHWHTHCWSIAE
ncbi:hypothetical protein [Jonesia denitrificans]|uniref:ATP/GTP-binding protein n=1 Tax=Jonesia denitrificans (strain ATCC 14870 / DSM 20603 / BCRC 15368 / CIP 55.134 / JCM 11481 / NBRC 15587 / NCTC 10816 / Prevot 55134) TaxID=471856 RepID=C7QYZ2_JONDD|nr:hypothetical protein [Jonesia denitrificans]ACV09381.1 hypothetical protein Jden_1736 [Jonesia denitrificans DSM 20603]ASE10134.1 hypothetical protein CEP80_09610 [Jonesia denitrificans]QXB43913.1 hypothetical protein I6L70_03260 [Jonesia denitrificans]